MGRKIVKITEAVWYVPDIDDGAGGLNRDLEDPFCVEIQPMTGKEYKQAQRATMAFKAGKASVSAIKMAEDLRAEVISKKVLSVKGYEFPCPSTKKFPKNGAELVETVYDAGGSEVDLVLDDIFNAILNHSTLNEGTLGNLKSQSEQSVVDKLTSSSGAASVAAE